MSKIEVNTVDVQCGSTLTLGSSGKTVALASGASQSGFGRTGTVDWQTGSIKTSDFTAVDGQGFFVDTNGGEVTVTLPTGSAGSIVSIQDYRNTFDTNDCTVQTAGSQKINGGTASGNVTLSTEGEGITLVYIDSTVGWRSIQDNDFASSSIIPSFINATGGTITTSGDDKIHTFTGPGTFCVSAISTCASNNQVSYVVIAGGGAGGDAGDRGAGGGGAGGFRETKSPITPYTASPLDGQPTSPNRITVSATAFPITVGAGGASRTSPNVGNDGNNSSFSTVSAQGGGGGGGEASTSPIANGRPGGSGGGAGRGSATGSVGSGNQPPVSPPQGNNGGSPGGSGDSTASGGGGGGAGAVGAGGGSGVGGNGGAGVTSEITASPVAYAGGGGGAGGEGGPATGGTGGTGGGGAGVPWPGSGGGPTGGNGTANTGGGGGAASTNSGGGAGGSGVVIIRYKFQ